MHKKCISKIHMLNAQMIARVELCKMGNYVLAHIVCFVMFYFRNFLHRFNISHFSRFETQHHAIDQLQFSRMRGGLGISSPQNLLDEAGSTLESTAARIHLCSLANIVGLCISDISLFIVIVYSPSMCAKELQVYMCSNVFQLYYIPDL